MATKVYSSNGQRIRRRLSVYDRVVKKLVLLGDSRVEAQNKARDTFKLINIHSQIKFNDYAISQSNVLGYVYPGDPISNLYGHLRIHNGQPYLFILQKTIKKMSAKNLNLLFAVLMALTTMSITLLLIIVLDATKSNLGILCMVSLIGNLAAALYYRNYRDLKRQDDRFLQQICRSASLHRIGR